MMAKDQIFEAIQNHNMELLTQILKSGISLNFCNEQAPFYTPLMDAIDELDYEIPVAFVLMLIEAGADVNMWSGDGQTNPLLLALRCGHSDIAILLLEANANPDVSDNEGLTPLLWATEHQDDLLLAGILKKECSYTLTKSDPFTGMTPLDNAVKMLNYSAARSLIKAGADPRFVNLDHRSSIDYLPNGLTDAEREKWESLLLSVNPLEKNT